MPTEQTEQLLTIFKQFYDDLKLTSEDYAIEEIPAERANLEIETATIEAVQKAQELFQVEQDRIRAEVLDEVEDSVDNLYKYSIVDLEAKERNDDEPVEAILPSEVKSILASLREEGKGQN